MLHGVGVIRSQGKGHIFCEFGREPQGEPKKKQHTHHQPIEAKELLF